MSNAKPLIMALRDVAVTYKPNEPKKFAFERRAITSERGVGASDLGLPGNEYVWLSRKKEPPFLTFDHYFISGGCLPFRSGKTGSHGRTQFSLHETKKEMDAVLEEKGWHSEPVHVHLVNAPIQIFHLDKNILELPLSVSFSIGYGMSYSEYVGESKGSINYDTAQSMVGRAQLYAEKLVRKAMETFPADIKREGLISFLKEQGFDVFEKL